MRPVAISGEDIVGYEDDIRGTANQCILPRVRSRSDERKYGITIGWSNR